MQSYLNLKKPILEVDKSTLVETPSAEVVLWSDPFPENYEKRVNYRTCSLTGTFCKIKYQRSLNITQDLTLYNGTILQVMIDLKPNRSHYYFTKISKLMKKCVIWINKKTATDVSAHLRPFSIGNINYLMQNLWNI